MKKFVMTLMLVLSICTVANASEVSILNRFNKNLANLVIKDTRNFDFDINQKQLGNYLKLNPEDSVNVANVCEGLRHGMLMAGKSNDEGLKKALVKNSIDYTVRNMKACLNADQYKKFLMGLNLTLYNRGFDGEITEYCSKNIK